MSLHHRVHQPLVDRVRAYCTAYGLLEAGPLLVAVSGGADSLTLLHVLIALRDEFGVLLHVATFDHGLRGDESAADVRFVREIAAAWNVPVSDGAADVAALAKTWRVGIEAAARRARYAFLAQTAAAVSAKQIATGHQRDDQAETVLMHVLRGAGLAGLRGMLPRAPLPGAELTLVRPLLDISRAEIDDYVRGLGIRPRLDSTNANRAYTRNWFRHEVLPFLEGANPGVRAALVRTAQIAQEDYAALQATLPPLDIQADQVIFQKAVFLGLHKAQQRMLIRQVAGQLTPDVDIGFERTDQAIRLIGAGRGAALDLGGKLRLSVGGDTVLIARGMAYPEYCPWLPPGTSLEITGPGVYTLPGGEWSLIVETHATTGVLPSDPLSAVLSIPSGARLELRTPRRGDRFKPHGMAGHSQKLSDTLVNMKVPAEWRSQAPLLVVGSEPAWLVAPFRDGPRGRITESFANFREQQHWWRFYYQKVLDSGFNL
jgi:tRNA(Ile)-lysidine synthetase-like protein